MNIRYTNLYNRNLAVILLIFSLSSCSDFLDVSIPSTQIARESVFQDDATALSALSGIYSEMMLNSGFASGGNASVTVLAGRSSDDFTNHSASMASEFSQSSVTESNAVLRSGLWNDTYRYIYYANAILEGAAKSGRLSASVGTQLEGEALFVRSFCYFYLVNLFGDVPLLLKTDFRENRLSSRTPVSMVYDQIVQDLVRSKELLAADYSASQNQRTRPNRWAGASLLARVQLFRGNWAAAEAEASTVIGSGLYSIEPNLNAVFVRNSVEAIWQLIPHEGNTNTREGAFFILTSMPTEVSLSPSMLQSFSQGDGRRDSWVGSFTVNNNTYYYPSKYKIKAATTITEYSMVLRLAEQYLIRAEARAQQGNLSGAISDLDVIRLRAGLPLYNTIAPDMTAQQILDAVLAERRSELFAEWGHRWLDLKRTGLANQVLGVDKGQGWQPTDVLYPIPIAEIQNNPNLLPQNPGY